MNPRNKHSKSRRMMFGSVTILDVCFTTVVVVGIALATHFWMTDRYMVLRAFFPFQASVALMEQECSNKAPAWLRDVLTVASDKIGSLASQVAYVEPNGRLHHCANGWAGDFVVSAPVTDATRFRYASVTKLFTADATLTSIDNGQLHLSDTLRSVFPDIQEFEDPRVAEITIEMLLRHTAGLDRMRSEDPLFRLKSTPWCPYDMQQLSALELDFEPGTRFSYSNVGYCILGGVLEAVTGQPYRKLIESQYALEENGIRFVDGPYQPDEVRYDFRYGEFFDETYYRFFDFHALSSSAGLSGSASALAGVIKNMLGRGDYNVLSATIPDSCDISRIGSCYGYAVSPFRPKGGSFDAYLHGGVLPGVTSWVLIDEYGGVTVLLGSGTPPNTPGRKLQVYTFLYDSLATHYSSQQAQVSSSLPALLH